MAEFVIHHRHLAPVDNHAVRPVDLAVGIDYRSLIENSLPAVREPPARLGRSNPLRQHRPYLSLFFFVNAAVSEAVFQCLVQILRNGDLEQDIMKDNAFQPA